MRSANREARRAERTTRRSSERALRDQQDRARQRVLESIAKVDDVDMRQHNAVITGVLPRIQGAVDSWCRRRVKMSVEMPSTVFSAMTDFESIYLAIPADAVSVDFLGDLRGLSYHEAGHLRKSVPMPRLREMVEATMDDATKAAQPPTHKLLQAWNVLEDQRMETSMVVDSKNLGRYYNVIVLAHVVNAFSAQTYCWLMARDHVDADVIEAAREMMIQEHGEAECERMEDCVWRYVETNEPAVMWASIVEMAAFLEASKAPSLNMDEHQCPNTWGTEEAAGDQQTLDESATQRPSKDAPKGTDPGAGEGDEDSEDDEDSDGSDEGEGAEGDGGQSTSEDKDSNGAGTKPGTFQDKVKDALERAKDARNADKSLTNDLRSYNEALHDTRNHTPLPRVPTMYSNLDGGDMAEAVRCNRALRLLMEAARAEHAPSWQSGQRTGVLDVIRYKTRQPGDVEFFRNEAAGGDMHLPNLAVSVLLDGSGSMSRHVTKLGVAAYAIKTACDACEVPCTVTVFDTAAHLLWDADDKPVNIPDAFCPLGGTDPSEALDVVDAQIHDKARHLVIIMTDGSWSGWSDKSLDEYSYPNRDIVVLFWNSPVRPIRGLNNVPHAAIDSLLEIPQIVRRYLIQSM